MDKFKENNFEKFKSASQIRRLLGGIVYFLLGFIVSFAEFPLSVHPLGVALSACASKKNSRLKMYNDFSFYMLFAGNVIASLTYKENGILYFTMYCALFFIRFALTSNRFNETRTVKMALSIASALCIGFVGGAINGFGLWEALGILILSVCACVFTYLFDGISDFEDSPIIYEAGIYAFLFAILYGIKSVHIFSFSLPMVLSAFITLGTARKKGALYGALTGLVCGIAGETFILPPVLGIMGFAAGIFFEYSDVFAILISYIGAIGYGIYCNGFDAVGIMAPEFLIACAAFFPARTFIKPAPSLPTVPDEADVEEIQQESSQLIKMSDAFSALSKIAIEAEKHAEPDKNECDYFVKRAFEDVCGNCLVKSSCTLNEDVVNETLRSHMSQALYSKNFDVSRLPASFSSKCRYSDKIVSKCLKRYRRACGRSGSDHAKLLSGEYNTVSKLLKSTAKKYRTPSSLPQAFKIKRALDGLGITYKSFEAKGSRRTIIDVIGVSSADIGATSEKIRERIQSECGFSVGLPEFFVKNSEEVMRVVRCPSIELEFAKASRTKSGEQNNGDCITVFENSDDRFYSLICDGMGSGRHAAAASKIASSFIEKLISSSSPEDITIEMLNNYLINEENECFSTIDLLEIDKLESTASFIKAGAAPAFIIRNGKLHKISSNTPPAGVLYNMTAEKTTMKLEKNDIIVMLSDGIIENGEIAPWLMELFTYGLSGAPSDMADSIISCALQKHKRSDDMSVAVMRIA